MDIQPPYYVQYEPENPEYTSISGPYFQISTARHQADVLKMKMVVFQEVKEGRIIIMDKNCLEVEQVYP